MKLHPIVHDLKTTLWCGPGALATISGQPSSVCMKALRDSTWQDRPIKGVGCGLLVKAAARLGYRLTSLPVNAGHKLTMAAWTRENAAAFAQNPVVLVVANHYVTVKGRSFNDNWCKVPMPLKKARLRRARVCNAYRVEEMNPDTTPPIAKPIKPAVARPARDMSKGHALSMASRYGVKLSTESGSDVIWVYAPDALDSEAKDHYYGDHACYDWAEALERVKKYAHDLVVAPCEEIASV